MKIERKKDKITEGEWIELVNNHQNVISLKEFENLNDDFYDYAILKIDNKIYGRLLWQWDSQRINLEIKKSQLQKVYKVILDISAFLNADFYVGSKEKFNKKHHLVKPAIKINRKKVYNTVYDLQNIRWLTVKCTDLELVTSKLKLTNSVTSIDDYFINNSNSKIGCLKLNELVILVFDEIPDFFINRLEGNNVEEQLKSFCDSLAHVSTLFGELEYYEHNTKSNITGYFKAKKGVLIYGKWNDEVINFEKGKIPKVFIEIDVQDAHEASFVWSMSPIDLKYMKDVWANPSE